MENLGFFGLLHLILVVYAAIQIINSAASGLAKTIVDADDARLERVLAERQTRSQAFFSKAAGKWDRLRSELSLTSRRAL